MRRRTILAGAFAWILVLTASGIARSEQNRRPSPKPNVKQAPKPMPVPFRVGESLTYRVSWTAFSNAAALQLTIPEQRNLWGSQAWHFRAAAHTQTPVRNLFAIDDQFDSYADASTLFTRQYEMHLNEMGKAEDDTIHFAPVGERTGAPPPLTSVEPGTRDPLDVVYALRTINWAQTPEFRSPVYDGRELYQIVAKRETRSDVIRVAAGSYSASRIVIQVFQDDKEMTAIRFTVWLADDPARTPVSFQASLPFGNVKAELTSIQ